MTSQSGQVFILAIIVLTLILINTLVVASNSLTFYQSSEYVATSIQALNLAEAGIDKATASLNATAGSYTGELETLLSPGSYDVIVTSQSSTVKIVETIGYVPNKSKPVAKRTIKIQISKGTGVSFNYAVQVGDGGLYLSPTAVINGSVYSNGNITINNNGRINGDAWVAGGTQPNADQQSDCSLPNCADLIFGQSSDQELDVAQSFQPSATAVLNKTSLKLKKFGSPPNVTVRIMADGGGIPDKNTVLTSGTLNANLVTSQYGFVDVVFSSSPTLSANTTYWIMIDTSASSTNYWSWSKDSLSSYTAGLPKWSPNWQSGNPTWNNVSGDLGFKIFMGGLVTSIMGANGATITGNVHANTLGNLTINKDAYYQVINPLGTVTAANFFPGSADPLPQALPVSDGNISEWKNSAEASGTQTGDILTCQSTLLKKKYQGNIKFSNFCVTSAQSPIWITGNLELDNGALIKLDPIYGASSGVIVVDGTITLSNNGRLEGSGTAGSYMMGLTTYDSRSNDLVAIQADNGSSSSILYAGLGKIILKNNSIMQEVTGWKIVLENSATITYSAGLASTFFSQGPSGAFNVVKGTYQSK